MNFLYYSEFKWKITMELEALFNLTAMVFVIIMTFYIDKIITPPIWMIFVPLFVLFGLIGLLITLILPGFLDKNKKHLKNVT